VNATIAAAHPFDIATHLEVTGDGLFKGTTSDAYWNFTGPFGGTTAATLLQAVMKHPKRLGTPIAVTVNFCAPVVKGGFQIAVREIRTNRSTQHWSMELSQAEAGITATATAVFAERRASWAHQAAKMPDVPAPETLRAIPTQGMMAWLNNYEFRFANGIPKRLGTTPNQEPASALSQVWINDKPNRPIDFTSLLALSDTFFGRIFVVRGEMLPIGTVSMTTYFHVGAEELAAHGEAPVLGVADANVFNRGYFDQTAELWSQSGCILATSQQIVYFRA
jgi:acyl-CoA thioesterase